MRTVLINITSLISQLAPVISWIHMRMVMEGFGGRSLQMDGRNWASRSLHIRRLSIIWFGIYFFGLRFIPRPIFHEVTEKDATSVFRSVISDSANCADRHEVPFVTFSALQERLRAMFLCAVGGSWRDVEVCCHVKEQLTPPEILPPPHSQTAVLWQNVPPKRRHQCPHPKVVNILELCLHQ
jgi:hypothetical protein